MSHPPKAAAKAAPKVVVRSLVALSAVALVLGACNREKDKPADAPGAPPAVAAVEPAAPMAYESKSPYADVSLTLPEALKTQPDLHAALYAEEVRTLRQFVEGAQGERTEAGFDEDRPPYEKKIIVTAAAETDRLLSLKRLDFDFSGGAHPNTLRNGLLWSKADKKRLGFDDIFAGGDRTALDRALCAAINTAKKARSPNSAPVTLTGSDWSCPRAAATPFVLTPGSVPGKAAGVTFLIGPYQVGPYSDGAYEIALPLSVFRTLLNPAYADQFGGELTRSGDVTPTN